MLVPMAVYFLVNRSFGAAGSMAALTVDEDAKEGDISPIETQTSVVAAAVVAQLRREGLVQILWMMRKLAHG